MTQEEAIERIKSRYDKWALDDKDLEAIQCIFPEPTESEDERIIEGFYTLIRGIRRDGGLTLNKVPLDKCETWLKKQKEQKPAECISDSVQFDEGFKTGREVGFREGVESVKQPTEDWREKRKKECPFRRKLDNNLYGCEQYADVVCECTGNCSWVVDYPKLKEIQDRKEQKPAEWSEEDEDMLNCCISSIEEAKENRYAYKETDGDTSYDHEITWLKSLRPSWKPSEEQMCNLKKVYESYDFCDGERDALESLYKQLKKLM